MSDEEYGILLDGDSVYDDKEITSKSRTGRNSESDSSDTETEVATKGDVA